jgi:cyclophilin family peptidyl-prolyl cis-trans isomerase
MRPTRWATLAVVGFALLLGGCGDEPDDDNPQLAAPTEAGTVAAPTAGDTEPPATPAAPVETAAAVTSPASPVAAVASPATPEPGACWTDAQRTTSEGEPGVPSKQYANPPAMAIDPAKRYTATMQTNKGTFEIEFFPQEAPQTVNNFVCLARDGYYDGTPFHRIAAGFVIQGGDPTGTGGGSPGYRFNDEPVVRDYERGIVAMANAGPNTNGSQFFVVLQDLRGRLPKNYTIFGRVTTGMEAVDAIARTPVRPGPSGENSQPTEPVTLERVTIEESAGAGRSGTPAAG